MRGATLTTREYIICVVRELRGSCVDYPRHVLIIQPEDVNIKCIIRDTRNLDDCAGIITAVIPKQYTTVAVTCIKG